MDVMSPCVRLRCRGKSSSAIPLKLWLDGDEGGTGVSPGDLEGEGLLRELAEKEFDTDSIRLIVARRIVGFGVVGKDGGVRRGDWGGCGEERGDKALLDEERDAWPVGTPPGRGGSGFVNCMAAIFVEPRLLTEY